MTLMSSLWCLYFLKTPFPSVPIVVFKQVGLQSQEKLRKKSCRIYRVDNF